MYQKVNTNLNFVDREKKVEEFWKENHIFEKSMENRKEGETYTFYDGPPTANGKPGSREEAWSGWQRADRRIRYGAIHQTV